MQVDIKIRGVEAVDKAISRFWEQSQKTLGEAMKDVLTSVYRDAYQLCPVDTGALRNSILISMKRRRVWIEGYISASGGAYGRRYAAYVELGTSRQAAQPFLMPAVRQNYELIVEKLGKALEEAALTASRTRGPEIHKLG